MSARRLASGVLIAIGLSTCLSISANADISCDDFAFLEDAQAILDGLGSDPYSLDEPRSTIADPNDGILCEDQQTGESQLVPASSADLVMPVLTDLGRDDLPPGTVQAKLAGQISEDFVSEDAVRIGNDSVELIGVEVPGWSERRAPDRDCYGEEAQTRLYELLAAGRTVYLEEDIAEHKEGDPASNPLRYVWIQDDTDGRYYLLNALMVREGIAVVAIIPPNVKYAGDLRAAQQEAIAEGAGLWGTCFGATYPPS